MKAFLASFTSFFLLTGSYRLVMAAGPYAFTQAPWAVTSTLNGMAGPAGVPSTAWFEWGPTTAYGQRTAPVSVGESTGVMRVSATVSNLTMGEVYHSRLVVSNAVGIAVGMDQPLITPGRMKVAIQGLGLEGCGPIFFPTPDFYDTCLPPAACNDGHPRPPIQINMTNIVAVSGRGLMLRSDGAAFANDGAQMFTNVVAISGGFPSVALRVDGSTIASNGESIDSGEIIAISGGAGYSLSLRRDGTVRTWVAPGAEVHLPPPGLSNVVAIAAGYSHSVALRIDGTVATWGRNQLAVTNIPAGLNNVVSVAAGIDQSVALLSDGTVVSWPVSSAKILDLTNVVAISASHISYALRSDGTVVHWLGDLREINFANMVTIAASGSGGIDLALGPNQPPHLLHDKWQLPENADSSVWLRASDPNQDPTVVKIHSLPTGGALYQYENGGRGAQITAPDTSITDSERRVIFAPAPTGTPLETSFRFTVHDGEIDPGPAMFSISIVPMFPRIRIDKNVCLGIERYSIKFIGKTNNTYRLWSSTNLHDWALTGEFEQTWPEWSQFHDPKQDLAGRFYKVTNP